MRQIIRDFVKVCGENLPILEPIYEFGSYQVKSQEKLANLRPFFPQKDYIGADMRKGPGVDVILDLHDIKLPSESVGTVLVLDTLEHVEFPRIAINEIYRILKKNGVLIISSVMNFPIHSFPYDFWRFTPEAFKSLLREFLTIIVDFVGNPKFPHTVIGIGFKDTVSENHIQNLKESLISWKEFYNSKNKNFPKSLIPPLVWRVFKKFFKKNL